MRKSYLLIFIASLLFFNCKSLSKKDYKKGVKQTESLNYFIGIDYFLKSWERSPQSESARGLAQAYYHIRNFEQSEEWYSRLKRDDNLLQDDLLQFAEVLIANSKYSEAKIVLNQMDDQIDSRWETLMKTALKATDLLNENSNYSIRSISELNTQYDEIAPFFADGGSKIMFVSDRIEREIKNINSTNALKSDMYGWTGNGFLKIYEASWDPKKEKVDGQINHNGDFQSKLHIGPIFIDEELEFATITQQQKFKKSNRNSSARNYTLYPEIFYRKSGSNDEFQSLPFNSPFNYTVSDPFYDSSTNRLYFSSDMEGGYGGADLYFSEYTDEGVWADPVNLGEEINTIGDERSPFWSESGKFYFASNGHVGLGGLDIFESTFEDSKYQKPNNLGSPINSDRDDFGFFKSNSKTKIIIFASDRVGGKGLDDIYLAQKKEIELSLQGKVFDRASKEVLEDAIVTLTNEQGNILESFISKNDGSFKFNIEPDQSLFLSAKKTEYMVPEPVKVIIPSIENLNDSLVQHNVYLDKIEIGRVYKLENIYYDFDKWNIREDAKPELDKLVKIMTDNPTLKIELSSHTDSRGADDYNLKLSDKRAHSVVSYLESKGISPSRMQAVGYGETKLINSCDNDSNCSEEKHQQNRRTEFEITDY